MRCRDVVNVRVRVKNVFWRQAMAFQYFPNALNFIAGVNHNGVTGFFLADNRAVACKRANGKSFKNHCAPEWARTTDLKIRNLALYPTELRARAST